MWLPLWIFESQISFNSDRFVKMAKNRVHWPRKQGYNIHIWISRNCQYEKCLERYKIFSKFWIIRTQAYDMFHSGYCTIMMIFIIHPKVEYSMKCFCLGQSIWYEMTGYTSRKQTVNYGVFKWFFGAKPLKNEPVYR